jgi:sugar lactone lactonase YvrE
MPRLEETPEAPVKAVAAPPAKKPAESPAPAKLRVKRRRDSTEDDLRKQIESAPELNLFRAFTRADANRFAATAQLAARSASHETKPSRVLSRSDLAGLPLRMGDACKLSPSAADHLQGGSVGLRAHLTQARALGAVAGLVGRAGRAAGTDPRPDPKILHDRLRADADKHNKWLKAEAIPALQQMLMAENEAIREVLIDQLSDIEGSAASVALAQRALFDLHPRVRELALRALQKRPVEEYRQVLLDGFRYPWSAVADHAAEAVVALKIASAVSPLLLLLDQPDPAAAFEKPGKGVLVRELVKVNHPRNCLMCHALSGNTEDKVRGQVPTTDQSLTPPYYGGSQGVFVRADITYLKQDFSVPLTVKNPGLWPEVQRFDFLVRERPAKPFEILAARKPAPTTTPHQQAVLFALRELTGADPGPTPEDWKKHFLLCALTVRTLHTGFHAAQAVCVDEQGRLYVADRGAILRTEAGARPAVWLKDVGTVHGLAIDREGQLLAAQGGPGRLARLNSAGAVYLAGSAAGKRFNGPRRLVLDRKGGVYFSDGPGVDLRETGAVYYLSAHGSVTRLPCDLSRPSGVGLAPDGKTLYVGSATTPEVMAYPVEAAGVLGKGRVLYRLQTPGSKGSADLAVDGDGLVYVLNSAGGSVEVVSPEGARAGSAQLPSVPVACAIGGAGKRTLYVLTRSALLAVEAKKGDDTRTASR